jgi:hypothetical protein
MSVNISVYNSDVYFSCDKCGVNLFPSKECVSIESYSRDDVGIGYCFDCAVEVCDDMCELLRARQDDINAIGRSLARRAVEA